MAVSPGSGRDRDRRKWQDPEAILKEIGLKPGDTFVDIGCGQGYFTIPAARIVGESGKIYALDISPLMVKGLDEQARENGSKNVYTRVGVAERTSLCEGCADFIFFGIVFHDFQDRIAALGNARRMLKKDGKLVDLDFKKIPMHFGPPVEIKLAEDEAKRIIEDAGFNVKSIKEIEPYSYLLIAGLE
ncbi:MAG: class I SAM-dependent methyltransferase [Syntrophales bacterium LBB04]|nr:class I SAM-dependent methyltransferase [Syntrophales bacterium LBB04]